MILPMLWTFTANMLVTLLPSVFSKNLNVSQSSWLNIPDLEHQRRKDDERSR